KTLAVRVDVIELHALEQLSVDFGRGFDVGRRRGGGLDQQEQGENRDRFHWPESVDACQGCPAGTTAVTPTLGELTAGVSSAEFSWPRQIQHGPCNSHGQWQRTGSSAA